MFIDDNNVQSVRKLVRELKAYIQMQKEYTQLEITEKLTILFSSILFAIVLILLGMVVLFYLSFSFAFLIAPYVGGLPSSYAIVSGIILLFMVLVIAFRKKLIVNPLANFLANLFLTNNSK